MEAHSQPEEKPGTGSTIAGVLLLAGVLVGLYFLVRGLCPADLPVNTGSNFVDSVFHNKGVVLAARLLLVSSAVVLAVGGVFIIVSIGIRMKNGEWLRKAGPFEVSETALSDIESQLNKWKRAAEAGKEEVAELSERLVESDELIKQLQKELDET